MNGTHDITAAALVHIVWARKAQLAAAVALGLAVGGTVSLVIPAKYESKAAFVGVSGNVMGIPGRVGDLGGLVDQLGLTAITGPDAGYSPYFFAALLTTDTILTQVARAEVRGPDNRFAARTVMQSLGTTGRSHADSVERAIRRLRRMIVVDIESRTSVVKVSVTARTPQLASQLAGALLGFVNDFLTRDLRTRAGAQRRFLQERLHEADADLHSAQDRLRGFLEANRDYRNSPTLLFRQVELQQELDLRRDLYLSVARSLEEARINEVRDTPLLSIIDRPSIPLRRSSPKPVANAALLGLFAPVFWMAALILRLGTRPGSLPEAT